MKKLRIACVLAVLAGTLFVGAPPASAATFTVIDVNLGSGSSDPTAPVGLGSAYYFGANNGTDGFELFKLVGTTATLLKNINDFPGESAFPRDFVAIGNTLFFTADDGDGRDLWKTKGTPESTKVVKEINFTGESDPDELTKGPGGNLYFSADDGTRGRELWRSDGTADGTKIVRNINPGAASSAPTELTPFKNGWTLFSADDGEHGPELWRTDGTKDGTKLVEDILEGPDGSAPAGITRVETAAALFSADFGPSVGREVAKTNGTAAGTGLIADINTGSFDSNPEGFVKAGDAIVTTADTPSLGREIVRLVIDGAFLVYYFVVDDVNPDAASSDPQGLVTDGDQAFSAATGPDGRELHRTTESGTNQHIDLNPSGDAFPADLVTGSMYFDKNFPLLISADSGDGAEPHVRDPETADIIQIADVNPTGDSEPDFSALADWVKRNVPKPRSGDPGLPIILDDGTNGRELYILPTLSINDVKKAEGDGGPRQIKFTVTLSKISDETVTVLASTVEGTATAEVDYGHEVQLISLAPGELTKEFIVFYDGDNEPEADEKFYVYLSLAANAAIARVFGTGTFLDDD